MNMFGRAASGALGGASTGLSIGVAGAAGQGAIFGSSAGPIGAGIGALVGLTMGLFGGGGSTSGGGGTSPKKIREALKAQNQITLNSLKRDAALAIQANEKAARLYNDLRDAKYEEELKAYEIAIERRAENYEEARKAYQDSVDAFDETVNLNDISASMAMNDARRVYNDRMFDLNIRSEALNLELKSADRDRNLANALVQDRMAASIQEANLKNTGINEKLRIAVRDGGNAINESVRLFDVATTVAEKEMEIQGIQLDVDNMDIKADVKTLEGEKESIISSAELKQKDVFNSLDNAIAESDFAQQELRYAEDERYAEAAIQSDQLRRQGLLEQSAQLAKGQAGRSAAKSVQGIAFANQQAQALLAAAIVRADSKYLIDKGRLTQSLLNTRKQAQTQLATNNIGLKKAARDFESAGLRMDSRKIGLGIKDVEAEMSKNRVADNLAQTTYQITDVANKFDDAKALAQIDIDSLSNELLLSQKQMISELTQNDAKMFDLQQQANLSFAGMAFAGENLQSQLKINNERIEFDKMLANRMAESQVLDEPKLPELLPPPIKAPDLVQQPLPDIKWGEIQKSMNLARRAKMSYNPSGISEFNALVSNIQGIGEQAANLVNAFKAPPQVQTPQEAFPISSFVNTSNQGLYGGTENVWGASSSGNNPYTAPTPQLGTNTNMFNSDYNYYQ